MRLPRPAGRSKWTNAKKIKLVVDSCVEFSQTPARVAGYLGAAFCLIATLLAVVGVVLAATPATGAGFWFVGALALLVGGLNLGFLSVMGEYVWRASDDARRRPIYVTRSVHDVVARRPREDREAVAPSEDDVVAPARVAAEAAHT